MPPQTEAEVSEIVERKVRHATGVRAMRTIRSLVEAINEEEKAKQKAARLVVLVFVALIVSVFTLFAVTDHDSTVNPPQKSSARDYADLVCKQIERSANAKYPHELKNRSISGTLVLNISVNANGQLRNVEVQHSSGNHFLDNAAIDLVKQESHFPPAPEDLRKQIDIFQITRSFTFANGSITQQP